MGLIKREPTQDEIEAEMKARGWEQNYAGSERWTYRPDYSKF
jgi:hypothetical protein